MSESDANQGRGPNREVGGGEIIAGLFGLAAFVAMVIVFIWATWSAVEPMLMAWCSYAWFSS